MPVIPLTKGLEALVDDEDYARLSQVPWHAVGGKYAARSVGGRKDKRMVYMHREIMGVTDPEVDVDHRDGNTLNNRRSNLRLCSAHQNAGNARKHYDGSSRFKGVYWDKSKQKWAARIGSRFIGRFDSEIDAARSYNIEAIALYGSFAKLNEVEHV